MGQRLDRLQVICLEISKWALHNFGNNDSKWIGGIVLGPAGPFLGMLEEIGELQAAVEENNHAEVLDSVADFLIFSSDYLGRAFGAVQAAQIMELGLLDLDEGRYEANLPLLVGKLCHVNLKAHQGIRGYSDLDRVRDEVSGLWVELLSHVFWLANPYLVKPVSGDLAYTMLLGVWGKIKSRDWKANALTAEAPAV